MRLRRRILFSPILIILNVVIFTASLIIVSVEENFVGGICSAEIEKFCFVPAKAFERPWSFITSAFLHADPSHLFYNLFALFFFGTYLERRIGSKYFLTVYLLSAIFGSFMYLVISPNSEIPALGASAAIFGVLGTLAILYPRLVVWVGFTPMPILFAAILWGLISFFGMFIPSPIAHHAHLGGLLTGVLFGSYLKKRRRRLRVIRYYFY
jgi:hypothetical protein